MRRLKTHRLKNYFLFKDKRGYIQGIFNSFKIEESNIIFSKSDKLTRGEHCHKKMIEILHVLDGKVILHVSDYKKKTEVLKKFKLTKGDTVVIYPDEYHWTTNSKNSRWINFLTRKFDQKKPDLFN